MNAEPGQRIRPSARLADQLEQVRGVLLEPAQIVAQGARRAGTRHDQTTKWPTRIVNCTVVPGGTTASAISLLICCTQPLRPAGTTTASAGARCSGSSSGSDPCRAAGHVSSMTLTVSSAIRRITSPTTSDRRRQLHRQHGHREDQRRDFRPLAGPPARPKSVAAPANRLRPLAHPGPITLPRRCRLLLRQLR